MSARCFSTWLRAQRGRDDPVGDLALDVSADRSARGLRTTTQVLMHLIRRGACTEARLAFREAAREYREQFRRPARQERADLPRPHLQLLQGNREV